MQYAAADAVHPDFCDLAVARRIEADDLDTLGTLMRSHNQKLYRTARSILGDDAEAEDAVQEAYVLAYQGISGYRGDAKLSTWLVRIVVNEAIGRLRKRRRTAEIIRIDVDMTREGNDTKAGTHASSTDRPEHEAMRSETRRLLEKHIDALPAAFRTVFVLRAIEEMNVEETAAALDIPPTTVRTRFFRARSLLREALAHDSDFVLEDAFAFAGERCNRIVRRVMTRLADRANVRCPILALYPSNEN